MRRGSMVPPPLLMLGSPLALQSLPDIGSYHPLASQFPCSSLLQIPISTNVSVMCHVRMAVRFVLTVESL